MPESQQHGFIFEAAVRRAYGLSERPAPVQTGGGQAYTRKHDIEAAENTREPGVNVSIKSTGSKSVDMGDALRVFDAIEGGEAVKLEVVHHKQEGDVKRVKALSRVRLDGDGRMQQLFGTLTRDDILRIRQQIRDIPAGPVSAETRRLYKAEIARLNRRTGFLKLRAKVGSSNQRRLQVSFSDFPAFVRAAGGETITSRRLFEDAPELPESIPSSRRARRARAPAAAGQQPQQQQ
jgi:hypothetical protein